MEHFFLQLGWGTGYLLVWLLCLVGVILSGLSFSGTWLIVVAAFFASFLSGSEFPGGQTVCLFLALAVAVEIADFLAGAWGVKKRGGSRLAGLAALLGGLLGMIVGGFIPVLILGPLFGMFTGCFAAAFGVEYLRLNEKEKAAHIAWGAVIARVLMLCLKLSVTLGMVLVLFIGVIWK